MTSSTDGRTGINGPRLPKWLDAADLPWAWAGPIALALSAQLFLIWTHVPWADEFQATALARESHTLADWYWNFRYEGHAPLWHLLLKIPLAFTDDPTALKIVQSIAVLCSAALLHLRAPFAPGVKFLLSLNYFLFFEYGVIARDYSLTVAFFFAAIAFRRQSVAWLFIALLPQGGLQSVMLAGICGIIVLREQGWKWWGVLLAGCGAAVALVWMWPAEDFLGGGSVSNGGSFGDHLGRALYYIGSTFAPVDRDLKITGFEYSRDGVFILGLGLAAPMMSILSIWRKSPLLTLLSAAFLVSSLCLSVTTYSLSGRHFGLWAVLLIGLQWTMLTKDQPLPRFMRIWMVILCVSGALAGLREMTAPFSTAQLTANALLNAGATHTMVAPAGILLAAEVNGLLRVPTYNKWDNCLQTFIRWRRQKGGDQPISNSNGERDLIALTQRSLDELKKAAAQTGGRLLLLLDYYVAEHVAQTGDLTLTFLRFIGKDTVSGNWRYLYRLDVPPDPNPVAIPACTR